MSVSRCVLVAVVLALHGNTAAMTFADVPLPSGAILAIVGDDMVQNGRRVAIATFDSDAAVPEVLDWYADRWPPESDHPGHVRVDAGDWRIVSRLEHDVNVALQLKRAANGGSTGFLSLMALDDEVVPLSGPPMPSGGSLLSETRSRDGSRASQVWILEAPGRAGAVATFYADALQRDGWTVISTPTAGSPSTARFARSGASADLVVSDGTAGRAVIVLTTVTESD